VFDQLKGTLPCTYFDAISIVNFSHRSPTLNDYDFDRVLMLYSDVWLSIDVGLTIRDPAVAGFVHSSRLATNKDARCGRQYDKGIRGGRDKLCRPICVKGRLLIDFACAIRCIGWKIARNSPTR
jgi:hypothetical protein